MIPARFPATLGDSLLYLLGRLSAIDLHCILWLADRVDEARLRQAVRLSLDAEPILGCRFVERWFRPGWERREDLDELTLCAVSQGASAPAALAAFVSAPVDPRHDPLVQVLVARSHRDTLCIKIAHEAADGPSGRAYVRQLLGIYQRLKTDPGYRPVPNVSGTRDMQGIGSATGLRVGQGKLLRVLRDFQASQRGEGWLLPPCAGDGPQRGQLLLKLAPERVKALVQYGRTHQATLTAVLLAGYYRAASAVFRPARADVVTMETAIDLRRFLPAQRLPTAVSNISSEQRFNLPAGLGFGDLVDALRDQLSEGLVDPSRAACSIPAVTLFPLANLLYRTLPFGFYRWYVRQATATHDKRPCCACLVNFGKLDADLADFHELAVDDMHWAAGSVEALGVFLSVTGFRGALRISLRFAQPSIDEPLARSLLEHLDRELPPFLGTAPRISSLDIDGGSTECSAVSGPSP
jgi:NRPS condensation-like uncharacterized protein